MGKRIGITYDLKGDWNLKEGDLKDANAEFDHPKTIERVIQALEKGGHSVKRIGNVWNLLTGMNNLNVDIIFNLCEGISGRNRESQVPVLLEMMGIPYVGSDGLTLGITLDKIVAKKLFLGAGIPTPRFLEARNLEALEHMDSLKYPLIVKTCHEGSSKGISQNSRVEDFESLRRQVHLVNTQYHQSALVEEFIKGTEFTAAVLGNKNAHAMPVAQVSIDGNVQLGDQFYTFERISSTNLRYVCPAKIPQQLEKRLQRLAVEAYQCVGCRDFGRVDFRVDEQGNPYILEINPLPSLSTEDVFNLFPASLGSSYDEVINQVLDFALARYGLMQPTVDRYQFLEK